MKKFLFLVCLFTSQIFGETHAQKIIARSSYSNVFKHPEEFITFYFPRYIKSDNDLIDTKLDTFKNENYSCHLKSFQENVLYNSTRNDEVYRFLWLRSFNRAVLISIVKTEENVIITTKTLDRRVNCMIELYGKFTPYRPPQIWVGSKDSVDIIQNQMNEKFETKIDSIQLPKFNAKLKQNTSKEITFGKWNDFKKLIEKCSFWSLSPTTNSLGMDGSRWILEGYKNKQYWFVDRWSPNDSFKECCEFLIKLSEAKDEEIY